MTDKATVATISTILDHACLGGAYVAHQAGDAVEVIAVDGLARHKIVTALEDSFVVTILGLRAFSMRLLASTQDPMKFTEADVHPVASSNESIPASTTITSIQEVTSAQLSKCPCWLGIYISRV